MVQLTNGFWGAQKFHRRFLVEIYPSDGSVLVDENGQMFLLRLRLALLVILVAATRGTWWAQNTAAIIASSPLSEIDFAIQTVCELQLYLDTGLWRVLTDTLLLRLPLLGSGGGGR